jgi:hypothetical protein
MMDHLNNLTFFINIYHLIIIILDYFVINMNYLNYIELVDLFLFVIVYVKILFYGIVGFLIICLILGLIIRDLLMI